MKFIHLISTIFLTTAFTCIFLFAGIFWFYSSADSKTLILLKDSLSTASGFFGGITTLIAAYIASRLFNDWKEQQRHINSAEFARIVMSSYKEFDRFFTGLNDLLIDELEVVEGLEADKDDDIEEILEIDEIVEMGKQLLDLFYIFHDDLVNYCYVSKSQIDLDKLFEDWEKDLQSYVDKLGSLTTELPLELLIEKIEDLTSDDNYSLVADFSGQISEIVLKPLRLED